MGEIRIGLIAYASKTGLGYQTHEIYKNIKPNKVLLIDLSRFNNIEIHPEWYENYSICKGYPKREHIEWLTDNVDLVFYAETPLNYELHNIARRKRVLTIQQYNYEFLDYFRNEDLPKPSVLASPSLWGIDHVKSRNWAHTELLRFPVDRVRYEFKRIKECKTIGHIIGRPAVYDRNGTNQFLDLVQRMKGQFNFKIFYQMPKEQKTLEAFAPLEKRMKRMRRYLEIITDVEDNRDMYRNIDLLVLPRRFGGLCLPMQESLSHGVPVIMTNVLPNYDLLPKNWLANARFTQHFDLRPNKIELYTADVDNLISIVDKFRDNKYMQEQNEVANRIAQDISWDRQKNIYLDKFNNWLQKIETT